MEMKYSEIKSEKCIRVQSMTEPFEGIYLGSIEGNHGTNYRIFSEDQVFTVYGTKVLHMKLAKASLGHAVKLTFLEGHKTKNGGNYFDVKVEVSSEPVPGFDLTPYLSEQQEY